MNQHKLGVLVKLVVALYALAYFGAGVALVGSGVPLEQALGLVLATLAIYSAAGLVALHRSPHAQTRYLCAQAVARPLTVSLIALGAPRPFGALARAALAGETLYAVTVLGGAPRGWLAFADNRNRSHRWRLAAQAAHAIAGGAFGLAASLAPSIVGSALLRGATMSTEMIEQTALLGALETTMTIA